MPKARTGQAPPKLSRVEFDKRFRQSFVDPAFDAEREAIAPLEEIAWEAYEEGRKAPLTRKAGPGFADPEYDLSVEWLATRASGSRPRSSAWAGRRATHSRVLRGLRLAAQRRHLPRRDLEDLPPRDSSPRGARSATASRSTCST